MDLNSPDEGILPPPMRRVVVECLAGSSNQPVNVGFYGGWGQPEGIAPISGPVTVAGLEYWFSTAAGAPFLRAWSRLDDAAGGAPWEYVVSFV